MPGRGDLGIVVQYASVYAFQRQVELGIYGGDIETQAGIERRYLGCGNFTGGIRKNGVGLVKVAGNAQDRDHFFNAHIANGEPGPGFVRY